MLSFQGDVQNCKDVHRGVRAWLATFSGLRRIEIEASEPNVLMEHMQAYALSITERAPIRTLSH